MSTSASHMAISVKGLIKKFDSRAVLKNLCLEIAPGESVAIVGANGSGKSTLLRALAGLLRIDGGEINWFGRPAADSPASRRKLGMVGHDGFLYPHLSARENLLFAARMYAVPNAGRRADGLIKSAGLELHAFRQTKKLSRGMRQRLSIIRALVHDPEILILDEPFSALDASGTKWLDLLLEDLHRQGRTICFTSHDLQAANAHSDRVLELRQGILMVKQVTEENNKEIFPLANTKAA